MKKKVVSLLLTLAMTAALTACGSGTTAENGANGDAAADGGQTSYTIGVCNYVDHASLNQIVDNLEGQLKALGDENGVTFEIKYDNCNADANVMDQIIANYIADDVDLMVGVATPVAMAMQAATEDNRIPVVFAAVSDPISTGLVESLETPGANITGTSDGLDTAAVMKLIFAADPEADTVALLYDMGQDSSTTPIAEAKAFLDELRTRNGNLNIVCGTPVTKEAL